MDKIQTEYNSSTAREDLLFSHSTRARRASGRYQEHYAPIPGSQIFDVVNGAAVFKINKQASQRLIQKSAPIIGDSLARSFLQDSDSPPPQSPPPTESPYPGQSNNCGSTGSMRGAIFNNRAIKRLKAPSSSDILFPVFSGDGWGNVLETIIEPQMPVAAAARVCCSENIPVVTNSMVSRCYLHTGFTDLAIASSLCYTELRQQEFMGLDNLVDANVLEALRFATNEIAFLGDGDNVLGIYNSNYIPTYYFPSGDLQPTELFYALASLRMLLPSRPLENLGSGGIQSILQGNGEVALNENTWILAVPEILYQQLALTMLPTTPSLSILQALETGSCCASASNSPLMPRVKLIPVPEFNSLGDDGRPFGLLYRYGSIEIRRPLSFLPLPPLMDGLVVRQVSIARVGSTIAYEPASTLKIIF